MSSWIIDEAFHTDANAEILRFIRQANPSAHSDVADELTRAGAGTPGVRPYCPDYARYAFVALHLQDLTIVGIAFGTSGLAFRLPESRVAEALEDGGVIAVEIGLRWIRFAPWTDHETLAQSRRRLSRWCAVSASRSAA